MLSDWTTADIEPRLRAALRLLEHMTVHPSDIDPGFVDGLRADGLDDLAIAEAAGVGFHYNFINRVADAFDFQLPDDKGTGRLAAVLDTMGLHVKGAQMDPPWGRGADGVVRPAEVALGWDHLLTTPGSTTPERRAALAAGVRAWWTERPEPLPLSPALDPYIEKIARHANRIIDEDLDALRAEGLDKDALVELTLVGSVAAALVGLEAVSAVLGADD